MKTLTLEQLIEAAEICGSGKEGACQVCPAHNDGEVPEIGYACGEYFILPISRAVGACVCSSFAEMHSTKEQEIKAWNRRVENG